MKIRFQITLFPKLTRKSEKTIDEKLRALRKNYIFIGVIFAIIITIAVLYIAAYAYDNPKAGLVEKISGGLSMIVKDPLYFWPIPSQAWMYLFLILIVVEGVVLFEYTLRRARVSHDRNTVKGSAKWGSATEFTNEYAEPLGQQGHSGINNYIYGQNTYLAKKPSHMRDNVFLPGPASLNTLIIGATGMGKTRYYLKPNLLQMNCSYAITDPSGDLLRAMGETLYRFGYNVRSFDIKNMADCNQYNPLKYCRDEASIKTIVQAFMANTKEEGESGGSKDPFWDNAMNAFLCSIISLLISYGDDPTIMDGEAYTPCFSTLCELTRMASAGLPPEMLDEKGKCKDEDYQKYCDASVNEKKPTTLGHIFNNIRKTIKDGAEKPYCLREWENYKLAPEKTATTILITTAVKLDPFNIDKVQALTSNDTVDLDTFGCQKDALFISTPTDQNGKPYLFLAAFMYSQLFSALYHRGESEMEGSCSLRLKNGEQIRWFPRDMDRDEVDEIVKSMKNASIVTVSSRTNKEDKYYVIVDDKFDAEEARNVGGIDENDIYRNYMNYLQEHTVSRRPTMELAQAFVKDLQDAKIKEHKGDGANPATENPTTCRFLLDEFANIGEIPMFQEMLATVRKYNITCDVIVQSITQLKKMYPDNYTAIDANCPETVFLGGSEKDNNEYISAKIGNETVITESVNTDNLKMSGGHNVDQRALMTLDELGRMDRADEVILISGYDPIMDAKYDYPSHPMYKYTKDYMNDQHKVGFYDYDFGRLPEIKKRKLHRKKLGHTDTVVFIGELTEENMEYVMGCEGEELYNSIDNAMNRFDIPGTLGTATV